jgi:ABC-type lipoprotein export system ATPase subunit
MELFRRLHGNDGQTILMVTHDDSVAAAAQRVARMKDGRVTDQGQAALTGAASTSTSLD